MLQIDYLKSVYYDTKTSIHSFITNVKEENYGRGVRKIKRETKLEGKNSIEII